MEIWYKKYKNVPEVLDGRIIQDIIRKSSTNTGDVYICSRMSFQAEQWWKSGKSVTSFFFLTHQGVEITR